MALFPLLLFAPAVALHHAPVPLAAPPVTRDLVPALALTEGASARVVISCPAASHVEVGAGLSPFGDRPLGRVAVALVLRRDATATCVDDANGSRGTARLDPPILKRVSPRFVTDAAGARIVVTVEGSALGPQNARDDGLYLVWPMSVERLGACPEAHADATRVIACATAAQVKGRGPARVRLQSAGRLEEASGAPLDLGSLLEHGK
ncbi:MAG: hypothetical protein ABI321_13400 [Polyangia bacterium]